MGRLDSLRMNHNPKKPVAVNGNDANAEVTAKKSALFAGFCFWGPTFILNGENKLKAEQFQYLYTWVFHFESPSSESGRRKVC